MRYLKAVAPRNRTLLTRLQSTSSALELNIRVKTLRDAIYTEGHLAIRTILTDAKVLITIGIKHLAMISLPILEQVN